MYGKTPKNARKVRCVEEDLIFNLDNEGGEENG